MVDTCLVTGTIVAPDGTPLRRTFVLFQRTPKLPFIADDASAFPAPVTVRTDADGSVEVELIPGTYLVKPWYSTYEPFRIVVPDEPAARLEDIQDAMPEPYLTQAQAIVVQVEAARDDAEKARDDAQGFRNDALSAAQQAAQAQSGAEAAESAAESAALVAQSAQSGAESARDGAYSLYGDLQAVEQAKTAAETAAATAIDAVADVQQETLLTAGMAEALGQIGVIGRSVETLRKRALAQGEVTIANADAGGWLIPAGNTVAVTLPHELLDTDYAIAAEIVAAEPGIAHAGQVVVTERAVNAFTLRVTGAARNIVVRWTLLNPRQLYQ